MVLNANRTVDSGKLIIVINDKFAKVIHGAIEAVLRIACIFYDDIEAEKDNKSGPKNDDQYSN